MIAKRLKRISDWQIGFMGGLGMALIVLSFLGDDIFHTALWGLGCVIVLAFIGIMVLKRKEKIKEEKV